MILGIETSCDETAAALATPEGKVVSSVVQSQLDLHAPYGGVVPELASRQHLRDLPRVVEEALHQAQMGWEGLSGVAVTRGPGLMGALLVGLSWGKAVAFARRLPFIGINHLEGHLMALELERPSLPRPTIGLVASGGHTNLYWVGEGQPPKYQLLASSRDDAVGEAFDKVAKLLGLPYPGGPAIELAALQYRSEPRIQFTVPRMKDRSLDFSYSGLKTAVRVTLEQARKQGVEVHPGEIAAAFQQTVIADLVGKTVAMARTHHARSLALTGGVAANRPLREAFARAADQLNLDFACPPRVWCTDNAAMIALAGARRLAAGERSGWDVPAMPDWTL